MFANRYVRSCAAALTLVIGLLVASVTPAAAASGDLCPFWAIHVEGADVTMGCDAGPGEFYGKITLTGPDYSNVIFDGPTTTDGRLGAQVTVPRAGSYLFHLEGWNLAQDPSTYGYEDLPFTVDAGSSSPTPVASPTPSPVVSPTPSPAPVVSPSPVAAPRIIGRTPPAGSKGFDRDRSIVVKFDWTMYGASATTARLRDVTTGKLVRVSVRYYTSAHTGIVIDPALRLAAVHRYRVELTSGLMSGTGAHLAATSWTFTTGRS